MASPATHYAPAKPAEPKPAAATWADALAHIQSTPDLRPDSIRAYTAAINAVRKILADKTPAEISVQDADSFKREFLNGNYARGHAADAATYTRSATSCRT